MTHTTAKYAFKPISKQEPVRRFYRTDFLKVTTALPLIWAELMATYAQRPERRVNADRTEILRTLSLGKTEQVSA